MNWNIIKNKNKKKENKRKQKAKKIQGYKQYKKQTKNTKISKCGWCKQPYIKTQNKQKYCSTQCKTKARQHQSRMKSHRWYHKNKHRLTEKQRWGLGSGTIGQHRHDDFDKEYTVITKELSRLGIKKWKK